MIDKLISFSLRNRVLIFIVTLLLIGLGVNAWLQIPIDAFPDVTNIQVQVISEAPGRSPVEVENQAAKKMMLPNAALAFRCKQYVTKKEGGQGPLRVSTAYSPQ